MMEDRYLFRAKRIDNGEWVQGFLGPHNKSEPTAGQWYIVIDEPELNYHYSVNIDPATIGQCTGRHSKYFELLYEGDIVEFPLSIVVDDYGVGRAAVIWSEDICGFVAIAAGELPALDIGACHAELEIIGDIHDNPELLKGAKP